MGDNIADLPSESGQPPVPPKTYQWEDIRKQKLEGRYPWTHLYKPPFDSETYERTKEHDYEPVIPMENRKTPPPFVKVTTESEKVKSEEDLVQDKHHLCIPNNEDIEDENDYEDDDDDTEEITAAELQNRLEERYFQQSPGSSKHEYELPETRSVSPAMTDDMSRESTSGSFQQKVHSQADKIKEKFRNLKDQISSVENSPCVKRKKDNGKQRPVKKNKFNFRKHNVKQQDRSNFQLPQAPRLSFSSLSSFSRSRSNSVKERERKRSQSSETDSQKKRFDFHFGTYPRIFSKKKKTLEKQDTPKIKHKSAPSSPLPRRSPFPRRWISKFTDHKKEEDKEEKKTESVKETVVQESIFISLHEDTHSPQAASAPETMETDEKQTSMKIDNKNFIFISLHEERFPEKLQKIQQESEDEILSDPKKIETARKFTNLLKKLETDRKLKSRRFANRNFADDKPEPVVITEITTDEEGDNSNAQENLENSVETPDDTRPSSAEPPSYVDEEKYQMKESIRASSEPKETAPTQVKSSPSATKSRTVETPEAKPKSPAIKTKYKFAEYIKARSSTPESATSKPQTPEPTTSKPQTPEPATSRPQTPEPIKSKSKFVEILKVKSKTVESKTAKSKTPERWFFRSKTPEPQASTSAPTNEPKEPSKFLKLKEILKDTEKLIKPSASEPKEKESQKFAQFRQNLSKETATPEPKRAKSKTPERSFFTSATLESKRAKSKTPERSFFRSKTPEPSSSTEATVNEPKESSKFLKLKEILKPSASESKEKESKRFAELKENLLKETEKIGTLKNKIKTYFAKETETSKVKSDTDDRHIYEEFDNVDDSSKDTTKRVVTDNHDEPVPQKAPRKKLKKLDSDQVTNESLSAFDDPALNDIVTLDEQQPMSKTYISASLQEVHEVPIEPEHSVKNFRNYEKALEKSRSHSSIEIDNNVYSADNTLARLETPVPPSRPSRTRSLQRSKRIKPTIEEDKENYDLQQSENYNTFPMTKPDKPRRKFHKHRTYSNSTNTDVKSVNELEDAAISQNIANSKQLSVSFLPLTSNIVGEPIPNYNLRETSSMIHLNVNSDPPLPPKRKKSSAKDATGKYNSLPNRKHSSKNSSKTSLAASETCNGTHADTEDFEYADDAHSTAASDTPPRRPCRKRSAAPSLFDEDRTSREIESLPSERSLCDSDSKDANGYAVIKPAHKSHSQPTTSSNTTPRRKSRRLSDFFTIPRIRPPTNYVSPASTTVYERRLPSPSRPPRKSRPFREPVYTNEENINVTTDLDFGAEEELNFNLATVEDDATELMERDEKNLQTDEVMERMKIRPLPPPPRPTRKPRDDKGEGLSYDYSQVKKNSENLTNNLNQETELKIINTDADVEKESQTTKAEQHSNIVEPTITRASNILVPTTERSSNIVENVELQSTSIDRPTPSSSSINVITAQKLNVSELNVAKLSISEIESSKLVTSNVDSVTMQISDIRSEAGNLVINSVHLRSNSPLIERLSPILQETRPNTDHADLAIARDVTPSSEDAAVPETSARSRISSMIPEVGSDEEPTSTITKVMRPNRRKPVKKEEASRSTVSETNQPTLAELMCQILQICHSSVGQAIHSLLEQIIPEDREKRNEVQAAIWVITIIVAGCLMLGLQTNEKIVHHHHWDFHFPPPH